MKKNRLYVLSAVGIVIILIIWLTTFSDETDSNSIIVPVSFGDFEVNVTTTGELEAKNSEDIVGPSGLREIGIYGEITIQELVPEGTLVDSGSFVAQLDKEPIVTKLEDLNSEIDKFRSQILKTKLDTSLELRSARDQLINGGFDLEQKQITLDQSKYEPPATIRQAKIDYERAERGLNQSKEAYVLRQQKAMAQIQEINIDLDKSLRKMEAMQKVQDNFTIYAPKPGMVIYRRRWRGQKTETGSKISPWDNIVAKLPDLKKMIINTYVNEVDISKVNVNQNVRIGIDAFPEKELTGIVTDVANIGEDQQNSNAKVFEVVIAVNEYDSIIRPAMTTKNVIVTNVLEDVLYLPIECIQNTDSLSFVYFNNYKQQVITGMANDNEIVILEGLKEADEVYLIAPAGAEDYSLRLLDPVILEKYPTESKVHLSSN